MFYSSNDYFSLDVFVSGDHKTPSSMMHCAPRLAQGSMCSAAVLQLWLSAARAVRGSASLSAERSRESGLQRRTPSHRTEWTLSRRDCVADPRWEIDRCAGFVQGRESADQFVFICMDMISDARGLDAAATALTHVEFYCYSHHFHPSRWFLSPTADGFSSREPSGRIKETLSLNAG